MATQDVIRDVGSTLVFLLRSGVDTLVEPENIYLSRPDGFQDYQNSSNNAITIFLHRVAINPQMRNGPQRTLADGRKTRPLLPIELSFLITPWAPDLSNEYQIIGRILRTFYDNGELGSTQLQGDSWEPDDSIQIIMESLPMDDHYRIWDSSNQPYRISLTYMVRVIGIEPGRIIESTPVLEAQFRRLRNE